MKKIFWAITCVFLMAVAFSGLFLNQAQASPVGVCPEDAADLAIVVLLPDDKDCTSYHRCSKSGPIKMPCAPGTYFNAVLEVCDSPENSGCIQSEINSDLAPSQ
ncbi:hypothetical protein BLD44_029490 [Mastigocladus laminosus UU774]|nr:hypothetical protein B4U84_28670 [Westiellopsis prolifica IICB1]TBR56707.1 hypothetical protein B4U84_28190 [Westiellopsis prolifica IICB1]TFI50811.1 hypothetical protein BLD44_029490 [Mastigocladus laminosus UU774]